jgi:hypothetical protein
LICTGRKQRSARQHGIDNAGVEFAHHDEAALLVRFRKGERQRGCSKPNVSLVDRSASCTWLRSQRIHIPAPAANAASQGLRERATPAALLPAVCANRCSVAGALPARTVHRVVCEDDGLVRWCSDHLAPGPTTLRPPTARERQRITALIAVSPVWTDTARPRTTAATRWRTDFSLVSRH